MKKVAAEDKGVDMSDYLSDIMKPAHVGATECLRRRLEAMMPAAWYVREDKPVRIPE